MAEASAVCDLSIRFEVTVLAWQGLTRFSWLQPGEGRKGGRARAAYRAAHPPPSPGAAPDRLGTSGQIWEGNVDGGAREGSGRRGSGAASQNSLLTANLQTRENLAAGQTPARGLPATSLRSSRDVSVRVFLGWLGAK